MKNRNWLLTGLMVLSINFMVGRQAYAQTEFTYNESTHTFGGIPVPWVASKLEPDFEPTIPSYCLREAGNRFVYEARIIFDSDDIGGIDNNGKVIFSVLNNDGVFEDICGGSFVQQFLLWAPRLTGVDPAREVSIARDGPDTIRVTLKPPMTMGGWCGPTLCGP